MTVRKILAVLALAAFVACAHPERVVGVFEAAANLHEQTIAAVERAAMLGAKVDDIRVAERVAEAKLIEARVAVDRYLSSGDPGDLRAAREAVDAAYAAVTTAVQLASARGIQ